MRYLPGPVRRRLAAHDERVRAQGFRAGQRQQGSRAPLDSHRWVFVVTYGRSGSTLVQGLLNTLPRTLVRGENGLYLVDLYRALAVLDEFRSRNDKHGGRTPASAFYGIRKVKPAYFHQAMNDIVRRSALGEHGPRRFDVLGFKEVLWHRIEPAETAGFFDAMDAAFPGALYVLNTRDPDDVVGSGFWKRTEEDEARRLIARVVEIQEHLRSTRPDRVIDVRYADLTSDDATVRDAQVRALGEFVTCGPVSEELLEELLATLGKGHGPYPFARG